MVVVEDMHQALSQLTICNKALCYAAFDHKKWKSGRRTEQERKEEWVGE